MLPRRLPRPTRRGSWNFCVRKHLSGHGGCCRSSASLLLSPEFHSTQFNHCSTAALFQSQRRPNPLLCLPKPNYDFMPWHKPRSYSARACASAGSYSYSTSARSITSQPNHRHNNSTANSVHHSADLARVMVPSDANVAGNVHGGTIMKMMEEAAGVAANRYFNSSINVSKKPDISKKKATATAITRVSTLMSRVERMTFQHPVHVGDVAKVHAEVVFASLHTVAVSVQVTAERMAWSASTTSSNDTGMGYCCEEPVCNKALLWLVGVVLPDEPLSVHKLNPKLYARALAPKLPVPDATHDPSGWKLYERAAKAYEIRKLASSTVPGSSFDEAVPYSSSTVTNSDSSRATERKSGVCFTPDYSAVELVQVMLPSDCTTNTGLVSGGVVMKLMDNACGVVAVRHCGTNIVTVSVDCVNLVSPVLVGDVLRVHARPTFTSSHSLEIEVSVIAERYASAEKNGNDQVDSCHSSETDGGRLTRQEIETIERAYFTFVSLPLDPSQTSPTSLPVRPLVLNTPFEHEQFEQGKQRYERRKALRQTKKETGGDED